MLSEEFANIIELIKHSRTIAIQAVNTELINLYWNVGKYISARIAGAQWGDKTVDELAAFIQNNNPELKGFNRRGLYRMKQFYETYSDAVFVEPVISKIELPVIVSTPVTQIQKSSETSAVSAKNSKKVKNQIVSPPVTQIENSTETAVKSSKFRKNSKDVIVSAVRTQFELSDIRKSILAKLSWTHHRTILARCGTLEEIEFYLRTSLKEKLSVREL